MIRFIAVASLVLACPPALLPAQISADVTITSQLTSSGFDSCTQASYSESLPVGPLPSPASLTGFSWPQSPTGLSMSSSGTATGCSFAWPFGNFVRNGTVRIHLTAPYETTCEVRIVGSYFAMGGSGSTSVSGAVQASLGGLFVPVPSVNQADIVTVGPAGTSITVQHNTNVSAFSGFVSVVNSSLQITWTQVDAASTENYGTGCLSAAPTLTATSLPQLGTNMTSTVSGVAGPTPIGLVSIGFSNTTSSAGGLPVSLTAIGMTDCWLLQSADLNLLAFAASATTLDFGVALPTDPLFVGVNLFTQAFCLAPGANALQVLASNGVRWQLGS